MSELRSVDVERIFFSDVRCNCLPEALNALRSGCVVIAVVDIIRCLPSAVLRYGGPSPEREGTQKARYSFCLSTGQDVTLKSYILKARIQFQQT
jgi:hypothetical protein